MGILCCNEERDRRLNGNENSEDKDNSTLKINEDENKNENKKNEDKNGKKNKDKNKNKKENKKNKNKNENKKNKDKNEDEDKNENKKNEDKNKDENGNKNEDENENEDEDKNIDKNDDKNEDKKNKNESEKLGFQPGENYYQLIKDCNRTQLIKKEDNLSEKVELFFSLNKVKNPNDEHSFEISIINNNRFGNITYLGKTENGTGSEIEFGSSFLVDFFFEREQIVIIEPLINNNKIENKKEEFALCKLMTRMDNKLSIDIEDIGTLEINYKKKENQNKSLNDETSIFQFSISLNNDIFKEEKSLEGIFFVIKNVKDGKKKRPVYKSHEYNFNLNEKKKNFIYKFRFKYIMQ